MSAADRAIRVSTAAAVLGVAGIAAYVSYWHAFEVVRAHGESGITARLEPATIDGLVYSSSMVVLYAARHRLPVPGLARWLLALGILATLAANVAHGGPTGQSARPSQPGPRPALWVAMNSCCGSSGPLPLAPWSANRLRTRQAAQRTTRSLGCGWSRRLTRACRENGAHRIVTPSPAVRVTVARAQSLVRVGPPGQVGLTRAMRTGPPFRRQSTGPGSLVFGRPRADGFALPEASPAATADVEGPKLLEVTQAWH